MPENKETYLGDGLYAGFDGYMFKLRAPREYGDHWVGLEPEVLLEFLRFVKDTDPTLLTHLMQRVGYALHDDA